jgi:hypothetical protein
VTIAAAIVIFVSPTPPQEEAVLRFIPCRERGGSTSRNGADG